MSNASDDNLSSFYKLLPSAVSKLPYPVRFRAENAIEGFNKAKILLPIDREMASFRAITAAEEAASALIRSLQMRGYPRSNFIDLKKHPHKVAVPFFLSAVYQELFRNGPLNISVILSSDPAKITVSLPVKQFVRLPEDMENIHLELVDPLGMIGTKLGVEEKNYFDEAVNKAAGSRKVDKLIASAANARNRILYAHDGGLPRSQVTHESIEMQERLGRLSVILSIAILQVEHHQGFALQCLEGFLKVIGRNSD